MPAARSAPRDDSTARWFPRPGPDAVSLGVFVILAAFGLQLILPHEFAPYLLYVAAWIGLLAGLPDLPRRAFATLISLMLVLGALLQAPLGFVTHPVASLVLPIGLVWGLAMAWPRPPSPAPATATPTAMPVDDAASVVQMFHRIYDASQIGMGLIAADRQFVEANATMTNVLRYSADELRGVTLVALAFPDDAEVLDRRLGQLLAGTLPSFQEVIRCVRKDCKIIWVRLSVSVVRDANDQVLFGLAMAEDVTDHRQLEERLRQRESEYAHATRLSTVGEMATGLAHEINQPLAAITNYAEASMLRARHGQAQASQQIQDLEAIAHQAERASEIIRRLRGFLRKRESRRGQASINDIIREVVEFTQYETRSRQIEVELDLAEVPSLVVDRIQIQQVLVNLIRNGVDAMSETALERRLLRITTRLGQGTVTVSVIDSGRGMPRGVSDRLFRPFFSTKPEGLGVGLSISRTIVEAHHGRLWAEPNPIGGTTFYFTLPARARNQDVTSPNLVESHLGDR